MDKKTNNNNMERQKFQMQKAGLDSIAKNLAGKENIFTAGDFIEGFLKSIKGVKGDTAPAPTKKELEAVIKPLIPIVKNGEPGKTPTDVELLKLIRPLIPVLPEVEPITDERLLELIRPLIPDVAKVDEESIAGKAAEIAVKKVKKMIPEKESIESIAKALGGLKKQWVDIEQIKGDFNRKVTRIVQQLGTVAGIRTLKEGSGIQIVAGENAGEFYISATDSSPNIYTETPVGLINGTNKDYTVLHDITTVLTFAINGMYIHRAEYTTSGKIITFINPLDTNLSGLEFDIIYS